MAAQQLIDAANIYKRDSLNSYEEPAVIDRDLKASITRLGSDGEEHRRTASPWGRFEATVRQHFGLATSVVPSQSQLDEAREALAIVGIYAS